MKSEPHLRSHVGVECCASVWWLSQVAGNYDSTSACDDVVTRKFEGKVWVFSVGARGGTSRTTQTILSRLSGTYCIFGLWDARRALITVKLR